MKKIALLIVVALLTINIQTGLAQSNSLEKKKYVASVVSLLRTHAEMLHQISENNFKYTENMARHAKSIQRVFGLVGPMDWHAAKSTTMHRRSKPDLQLDDKTFEELADKSLKAIKYLYSAAHKEMKGGKKGITLEALDEMQKSCGHCHALLPKGTAPQVWDLSIPAGQ
jgi:cytochrome c556